MGLAVVGGAGLLGCYHPEPVDSGAVLSELRRADSLPAPATPPPTGTAPGTLTEAQSVALALTWNHDLRAFRLSRGVREGQITVASTLNNPVFRFELTHVQEGISGFGWDARLSWTPPQPGVWGGRIGTAKANLKAYDWQVKEREWGLLCSVRAAYAGLLAIDEEIRVAEESVANRRKLVDLVQRQMTQGGSTRFNLDLITLSLTTADRAQAARKLAREKAAMSLTQLLGVGPPNGASFSVNGVLDDEAIDAPLPDQTALEDRALANRPALEVSRAQYQASEQTVRAETAARWPWISLSSIPRVREQEAINARTDLALGVDVTLPIFDTNVGRVEEAKASRATARAEMAATIADVRNDIAQALASVRSNRDVLRRLHAEIEPLLQQHDRLLQLVMKAGELDLTSLIQSEDLVLAARTQLIQSKQQLREAHIALERAVGPSDSSFDGTAPPAPQTAR